MVRRKRSRAEQQSPDLILASQSPARKRLLKRLGVNFKVRPAHIDEKKVEAEFNDPRELVAELAALKARKVSDKYPEAFIIGSDQVLVCDGVVFGKPGSASKARAQLRKASGKKVSLFTGVSVLAPSGQTEVFVQHTQMTFRELSDREIASYVKRDDPTECAGSFKFESFGIALFNAVETDDPTAIEGLPLLQLAQSLRSLGALEESSFG